MHAVKVLRSGRARIEKLKVPNREILRMEDYGSRLWEKPVGDGY